MATNYLDYKVPVGLFQKTTKFLYNHISVRKFFREILKWLHVDFYDCSCPTDNGTRVPLGYDTDTDTITRYDPENDEYVAVEAGSVGGGTTGFTGEIEAVEGTYTFTDGVLTDFEAAP